jgi:DNA-binding NtrC family response regulator
VLLEHFWHSANPSEPLPTFDPTLMDFLATRDYPGNVRDLRRIVTALRSRHAGGGMVSIGALPERERPMPSTAGGDDAEGGSAQPDRMPLSRDDPLEHANFLEAIRQALAHGAGLKEIGRAASSVAIRIALEQEGGNLRRAADRLGVTDRALQMRRANGEGFSAQV